MMRGKFHEFLIDFFLMFLVSFSFAFMGLTDVGFSPAPLFIIRILVTILLIYSIIFINKKTTVLSLTLSMFSLAIWIIYILKTGRAEIVLIKHYRVLIWLYEYIYNDISVNWTYAKVLSILICSSICLGIYLFTKKKWHYLILTLIGSAYFLYLWYLDYLTVPWTMYLFLFSCLLYFFRHRYYKYGKLIEKENIVAFKWFMLWGMLISTIVFIFSYYYSQKHVIQLQWVRNIVDKYTAEPAYYYESDTFSVMSACFGEGDGRLGGNLTPNEILVLKISSPQRVYLKGIMKDTYTGHSWLYKGEPYDSFHKTYVGALECREGIKILSDENVDFEKYFEECDLEVEFQNIITKTIFVPENLIKLETDEHVTDRGDGIFLENAKGKGYRYSVKFYYPKKVQEDFIELIRKSKKGLYKERYNQIIQDRESIDEHSKLLLEQLIEQSEDINEQYLNLPESLPERVRDLAYEITKDKETDYDKVKAIEDYFLTNFHYTYNPGDVPLGRDFVDYFLFDSKEGYCTYYATAMTVLVRSIGLPARYVEGYCLTRDTWKGKNEYWVTNMQAHAWTEVYFEGIGWISFEPTPPYRREFDENYGNQNISDFYRDYYQNLLDRTEETNINNEVRTGSEIKINIRIKALYMLLSIFIILIMILVMNLFKVLLKIRKMIHGDGKESAILIYEEYLKIANLLGYPIKETETPLLYSERVHKIFNDEEITPLFLKARYSPNALNHEEMAVMYNFYKNLIKDTKDKIGKYKFFIWRFILGKI